MHWNALRFMLPRKAQKILHDTMSTLSLLVELVAIFQALRTNLSAGSQQLAVAKNRREWIVQFVRHSENRWAQRGNFLAVQKLFLHAPYIVISLAGLVVPQRPLDGPGDLAACRNQQIDVGRREIAGRPAAHHQPTDHFVLGP